MGKVISIHSSRGGTGKTVIAVNLAMILLKKGYDVSLLDLDFRAPSLFSIFANGIDTPIRYWLNDLFNKRCETNQALIEVSKGCGPNGKILVGLANPSIYAVQEIMGKSRMWEASFLRRLLSLGSLLLNGMGMDYVIYDTGPGIQYSSINAIVSSDLPILVVTPDPLDIEGARSMLSEFHDVFEKRTAILVNKAFPESELSDREKSRGPWEDLKGTLGHPIMGVIPCYCDVLRGKRDFLFSMKNPTHPFVRNLEEIAEKLVEY